jgi:serine/threonine protein phosphatase PrpC
MSFNRSLSNISLFKSFQSPSKNLTPQSKHLSLQPHQVSKIRSNTIINEPIQNPRKTILPSKLIPIKVKKVLIREGNFETLHSRKSRKNFTTFPSKNPLFLTTSAKVKISKSQNEKFQIAFTSQAGMTRQKRHDINQDRILVMPSINNLTFQSLVAVFDGHGSEGHQISEFLKSTFSFIIESKFKSNSELSSSEIELKLTESVKELVQHLKAAPIDVSYSGSTLLCLFFYKSLCFSVNVGDSKSFLYSHTRIWKVQQLNSTHKPSENAEKNRVLKNGGCIGQALNELGMPEGPLRVLGNSLQSPGITLTRAVGDSAFKEFGIIDIPEICRFLVKENDVVFVVASDGLWDFLSENFVADVLKRNWSHGGVEAAVMELIAALDEVGLRENIDDVSIVVLFKQ